MRRATTTLMLALVSATIAFNGGEAALFGTTGLDPAFCQIKPVRKTVVYIDESLMVEDHTEWAAKISDKLRATLTPGEPVAVVKLSPTTGQSVELWAGCWPNFSAERRAEITKETYIFSKSPLDGLSDQQTFFLGGFGSALTKIYLDNKRPGGDIQVDPMKPPSKQILRAIASDEGRFSNSRVTIRAILYSDMLENSDLGSVFKPLPDPMPNYAEKLGSHLRRGVFYAFGIASDVSNGQNLQENAKAFWTASLKTMSGVVGGIGSDLNLSNDLPVRAYSYDIELDLHGDTLDGKMSLLVDDDGVIVDSWVAISRLAISGLTGSFKCQGLACKLDASTTSPFVTKNMSTERLILSGKPESISGQVGIPGSKEIFAVRALAAAD